MDPPVKRIAGRNRPAAMRFQICHLKGFFGAHALRTDSVISGRSALIAHSISVLRKSSAKRLSKLLIRYSMER